MMGAIKRQSPVFLALAVVLAFALCSAHAADNKDQVTATGEQNAKKLARIHLLARAGKNEEAAAEMRTLYPLGPPDDDIALGYYRIIGNTSRGWNEAKIGLEKLVKAMPGDMRYRWALARHLTTRSATRHAGIKVLAALARAEQPDTDNQYGVGREQVLDAWRSALVALDHSPDNIRLYREYLAVDPGNAAVRNALAVAQRAEAERQPWILRDKADALLKEGHPEAAMTTLKHALQLAPTNPWVRFDLARLYHKRGFAKQGRALIDEGLTAAPDDPDMLYACALYLGLLDEANDALRLLDKIPAAARTPAMLRLRQKMAIQSQTQQAKMLLQNGHRADALTVLEHAETEAGDDAELVSDVADAWIDLDETARGMALLQRLLTQQSTPPVELKLHLDYSHFGSERKTQQSALPVKLSLRYATLLNQAEHDDELAPLLDHLNSSKELSDKNREDLRYLQASLAARRADKLRHAGEYAEARAVLGPALEHDPENTDLWMALARVHVAAHQSDQARAVYQRILERAPGNINARLALAKAMGEAGDKTGAQREMLTVLASTPADDLEGRLSIADWYMGMDDIVAARGIIDQLRKIYQDNPEVLIRAGRIAQAEAHYGEAMDYYKQTNAADEIADLKRRRAGGYITTGVDYLSKRDGTSGISNLTAIEIPIEVRMPVGYDGGQAFVQVDPVSANAGTLQLSDLYNLRQYGKVLALSPTGSGVTSPSQAARGTAVGTGYEGGGLRADIGTTPLGFPVSDVVGGIKWSRYTETTGFSFDVSRRPVISSLLSYAGAHDPVSNEVWGGVRSSGMSLHVSRDRGRLSGFADLGYYWLTGKNVLGNTESALRTGFDWNFIREKDMRMTAGLAFTDWHYRENLRYYTFGHGGYYSPQKYYSLAIPFRWTGRKERWSYLLQGSVSVSASYEKNMPYYPTDAALQGLAANATYTGGPGHGIGHSLGGMLEYRFTPQLFGGTRLQIDRSNYYTPNYATLYLRYLFDAHTGPVPYPPDPVKPYSRF
jgi:tetratricopeptide (TPR) repeat protein